MLCCWAEQKYGLSEVTKVEFEPGAYGPYSDVTPDLDLHMEVIVQHAGGRSNFETLYTTNLVREVMEFARDAR